MRYAYKIIPIAALAIAGATGCDEFLTGGELTTDPNRPTTSTARQLFVGVQSNLWAYLASDPVRTTEIWAQHLTGVQGQYLLNQQYSNSENTTNGFNQGLYTGGGLVDIRRAQGIASEGGDSVFVGTLQVQEALLMGIAADLFGDVVYSQALTNEPNPPLDNQLEVYAALQTKLDSAIVNLAAAGPTNVGPGVADLAYGGNPALWTKLAHTVKARLYMRTAEVDNSAYANALTEAAQGLTSPSEDFIATFSGASNEQNFWYQFFEVQRAGYIRPNPTFVALLETRNDPRRNLYFDATASTLSATLIAPDYTQPLISANENLLNWAEAAYRTGATGPALAQLNAERALWAGRGVTLPPVTASGEDLLREILAERYIALFQTYEPWNQYKRTCFPNLGPTVPGGRIPARFYYDTSERQTNSSIPPADQQPTRNRNDPVNGTDPFGAACRAEPPASNVTE
ncbi:MAG: SusD/RagB family nutrient-binding outer membrane lipoprotein [Gemmatimonadaceae bacterium]